jgi:hypothetical protein
VLVAPLPRVFHGSELQVLAKEQETVMEIVKLPVALPHHPATAAALNMVAVVNELGYQLDEVLPRLARRDDTMDTVVVDQCKATAQAFIDSLWALVRANFVGETCENNPLVEAKRASGSGKAPGGDLG